MQKRTVALAIGIGFGASFVPQSIGHEAPPSTYAPPVAEFTAGANTDPVVIQLGRTSLQTLPQLPPAEAVPVSDPLAEKKQAIVHDLLGPRLEQAGLSFQTPENPTTNGPSDFIVVSSEGCGIQWRLEQNPELVGEFGEWYLMFAVATRHLDELLVNALAAFDSKNSIHTESPKHFPFDPDDDASTSAVVDSLLAENSRLCDIVTSIPQK